MFVQMHFEMFISVNVLTETRKSKHWINNSIAFNNRIFNVHYPQKIPFGQMNDIEKVIPASNGIQT